MVASGVMVMGGVGNAFAATPAREVPPPRSAPISRQTYAISDFDTVRLETPVEVVVTTGKGVSAIGTGDRDTLDALDLQMTSRTLYIRMRNGVVIGGSGGKPRAPTRIVLTTGELHRALVLGPGSLSVDRLKGQRVEATVRGSGRLSIIKIEADRIDVGLLGSGSMTLGGTVLDMVGAASGSGRLDASALDVRRLRIEAEGNVDVQVTAREEAIATANGAGRVVVTGKAKCTVRKIGSASISCGGDVY